MGLKKKRGLAISLLGTGWRWVFLLLCRKTQRELTSFRMVADLGREKGKKFDPALPERRGEWFARQKKLPSP